MITADFGSKLCQHYEAWQRKPLTTKDHRVYRAGLFDVEVDVRCHSGNAARINMQFLARFELALDDAAVALNPPLYEAFTAKHTRHDLAFEMNANRHALGCAEEGVRLIDQRASH